MKRLAFFFIFFLFLSPPVFATYETGGETTERRRDSGAGTQVAVDVFSMLVNQAIQSREQEAEEAPPQPPPIVTVAEFPADEELKGPCHAEVEATRGGEEPVEKEDKTRLLFKVPVYIAPSVTEKHLCCELRSLELANAWYHPLAVSVEKGSGKTVLDPGETVKLEDNDWGECVRVNAVSVGELARPGEPRVTEDARFCCHDLRTGKSLALKAMRLVHFTLEEKEPPCDGQECPTGFNPCGVPTECPEGTTRECTHRETCSEPCCRCAPISVPPKYSCPEGYGSCSLVPAECPAKTKRECVQAPTCPKECCRCVPEEEKEWCPDEYLSCGSSIECPKNTKKECTQTETCKKPCCKCVPEETPQQCPTDYQSCGSTVECPADTKKECIQVKTCEKPCCKCVPKEKHSCPDEYYPCGKAPEVCPKGEKRQCNRFETCPVRCCKCIREEEHSCPGEYFPCGQAPEVCPEGQKMQCNRFETCPKECCKCVREKEKSCPPEYYPCGGAPQRCPEGEKRQCDSFETCPVKCCKCVPKTKEECPPDYQRCGAPVECPEGMKPQCIQIETCSKPCCRCAAETTVTPPRCPDGYNPCGSPTECPEGSKKECVQTETCREPCCRCVREKKEECPPEYGRCGVPVECPENFTRQCIQVPTCPRECCKCVPEERNYCPPGYPPCGTPPECPADFTLQCVKVPTCPKECCKCVPKKKRDCPPGFGPCSPDPLQCPPDHVKECVPAPDCPYDCCRCLPRTPPPPPCQCQCEFEDHWESNPSYEFKVISPTAQNRQSAVIKIPVGTEVPFVADGEDRDLLRLQCHREESGGPDCSGPCDSERTLPLPVPLEYGWQIIHGEGALVEGPHVRDPGPRAAEGPGTIYRAPQVLPPDPSVTIRLTVDDSRDHNRNEDDGQSTQEIRLILVDRDQPAEFQIGAGQVSMGAEEKRKGEDCPCQPEKKWEPDGALLGDHNRSIFGVCAGGLLVLSTDASDTDELKVHCRDEKCPSPEEKFDQDDLVYYQWRPRAGRIIGTRDRVVFQAPEQTGRVKVDRTISDSGLQGVDGSEDLAPIEVEVFKVKILEVSEPIDPEADENFVRYRLEPSPVDAVRLEIYDKDGKRVRTIEGLPTSNDSGTGFVKYLFKGQDDQGQSLNPEGKPYRLRIVATKHNAECPDDASMEICGGKGKMGLYARRSDDSWVPTHEGTTGLTAETYRRDEESGEWVKPGCSKKIHFKFTERSNQKGISVNDGHQVTPDLSFSRRNETQFECSDRYSWGETNPYWGACVTKKPVREAEIRIASHDYGGFSKIRVFCEDCVPLIRTSDGRLVEDSGPEGGIVRVPKDDNDNQISDGYPPEQAGRNVRPEDDSETNPPGNGVAGDGFSAYEEYRGFMVQGTHTRTSWDFKDLFIFDRDGIAAAGIQLFSRVTGLAVHSIGEFEMDRKRVVNFNGQAWSQLNPQLKGKGHAHILDQHGLIIVRDHLQGGILGRTNQTEEINSWNKWSALGLWDAILGPPKNVVKISIDSVHVGLGSRRHETVAHELGHAVKIRHHGEGRLERDTIHPRGTRGVKWVSNIDPLCHHTLPHDFSIGEKGNQASGLETCIMRYAGWGSVYPFGPRQFRETDCRPEVEPPVAALCTGKLGQTFNIHNQYAGKATKGNCAGQIQVKDV